MRAPVHKRNNDRTESARGLGRRQKKKKKEIGKGHQITALKFQTGGLVVPHQPPVLEFLGGGGEGAGVGGGGGGGGGIRHALPPFRGQVQLILQ